MEVARRRRGRTPRAAARGARGSCPGRSSTRARRAGRAAARRASARVASTQRAEVGLAVRGQRRRDADEDRVAARERLGVGGRLDAVGDGREALGGDVLDVGVAVADRADLARVGVEADDVVARLGEGDGERQAHVAEADDPDGHSAASVGKRPVRAARSPIRSAAPTARSPSRQVIRSRRTCAAGRRYPPRAMRSASTISPISPRRSPAAPSPAGAALRRVADRWRALGGAHEPRVDAHVVWGRARRGRTRRRPDRRPCGRARWRSRSRRARHARASATRLA